MALKKSKVTAFGPTAEYWRVTGFTYMAPDTQTGPANGVDIDLTKPVVNATICLYTNAEDSASGKKEFERLNLMMNISFKGGNFVDQIYNKIKEMPQFEGYVDV